MPIGITPDDTFDYVLEDDRDKPKDQQRTLVCRFLTAKQERQLDRLFAETTDQDNPMPLSEAADRIVVAIGSVDLVKDVRGFEMPEPGTPGRYTLRDALTRAELIELRDLLPAAMTYSALDLKNSRWRSASTSAKSAGSGQAAGA